MLTLLALLTTAHAEPFERSVEHALAVHLPPDGLRHLGDAIEAVVPPVIPVEGTDDVLECSDETQLDYQLAPIDILLSADDVELTPSADRLDITLFATLDTSATTLAVQGDCALFEDLDEVCGVQLPTTAIEVHVGLDLFVTDGVVDAVATPITVDISPIANPLSDCLLSSAVGTILGQNPSLIDDLLTDAIGPALEDVPADLEAAVEDALNGLSVDTELDLAGVPLQLNLAPNRMELSDNGLVVGMSARLTAPDSAACAPIADVPLPETSWPVLAETAPDSTFRYDVGAYLGQGFLQELLTSVWGSGLLCQEVSEFSGTQLSGELVNAFFGGHILDIAEPDAAAVMVLGSDTPPAVTVSDDQPVVRVDLSNLELDLVVEVDGRMTRMATIGVIAEAGLDIDLTGTEIAPTLALQPSTFRFEERYSELLPPGYSAGLPDLLDNVLGGLLPDGALTTVTLPAPLGIGLDQTLWKPTAEGDWLGLFLRLDLSEVEPIELTGCSASGLGCGSEGGGSVEFDLDAALGCGESGGCESGSGCSVGTLTLPARPLFALLFLGPFLALRRRRDA